MSNSLEHDRAALWLPLLARLTDRYRTWAIWKNPESALYGHGDVDSLADPSSWPGIEAEFRAMAAAHGLETVIICRCVPQGPHLVALGPDTQHLVQLDVKERATFRGSSLVSWQQLLPLSRIDDRGFRRARPGTEGVIKLLSNGMLPGGRPHDAGLRAKGVAALLADDPAGVAATSRLFGPAAAALRRGCTAAARGEWSRRDMLAVEAWCLLRSVTSPATLYNRLWFRYRGRPRCPVLRVIRREDRVVPADREAWLASVRATHREVTVATRAPAGAR